jgi:hypothetical protein
MNAIAMNAIAPNALKSLILEARQYPVGSYQQQRLLTEVIRQMQRSGQIWRAYYISQEQYQEALQRTWIWFYKNLHNYDPTQSNPITWFNYKLKFCIKTLMGEEAVQKQQIRSPHPQEQEQGLDIIDTIPAPPLDESWTMLVTIWEWLQQERSVLELKTVRHHPEVTAYLLLIRRLPTHDQASWAELAAELGVPVPTLSSFYRRHCLPLLREFIRSQGWDEDLSISA